MKDNKGIIKGTVPKNDSTNDENNEDFTLQSRLVRENQSLKAKLTELQDDFNDLLKIVIQEVNDEPVKENIQERFLEYWKQRQDKILDLAEDINRKATKEMKFIHKQTGFTKEDKLIILSEESPHIFKADNFTSKAEMENKILDSFQNRWSENTSIRTIQRFFKKIY